MEMHGFEREPVEYTESTWEEISQITSEFMYNLSENVEINVVYSWAKLSKGLERLFGVNLEPQLSNPCDYNNYMVKLSQLVGGHPDFAGIPDRPVIFLHNSVQIDNPVETIEDLFSSAREYVRVLHVQSVKDCFESSFGDYETMGWGDHIEGELYDFMSGITHDLVNWQVNQNDFGALSLLPVNLFKGGPDLFDLGGVADFLCW